METRYDPSPDIQHAPSASSGKRANNNSDERLFLAILGANEGLWDWNLDSHLLYLSPRLKEMLGYTEDELFNQFEAWHERLHPDDAEQVTAILNLSRQEASAHFQFEYRARHKDGSYRWFLARGRAVSNQDGRVCHLTGWHADITEHKLLEERRQRYARHTALRADIGMILAGKSNLHTMLQQCCQSIIHHLQIEAAYIWRFDAQTQQLELLAGEGVPYSNEPIDLMDFPHGANRLAEVVQTRHPFLVNDIVHDALLKENVWARRHGFVAQASYPLIVEENVEGILSIFSKESLSQETYEALILVGNAVAQGMGRKLAEIELEMRVQQRTHELSLLLRVAQIVAARLEMKPLLKAILEQLKTIVDYDDAGILGIQGGQTILLHSEGIQERSWLPLLQDLLVESTSFTQIQQQREVMIVNDLLQIPTFVQHYREKLSDALDLLPHFRSWMGVPLLVHDRLIGLLTLNYHEPNRYRARDAHLAFALANQAAIALENASFYEQARDLAALQERQRLARELHDSVSQEMYAISLSAQAARENVQSHALQLAQLSLDHVLQHAQAGLAEMRSLLFELRPNSLEIEGLIAALKRQVEVLRTRRKLRVDAQFGDEPPLSNEAKHTLYRVAQEAINNIIKHAHADHVTLELRREERECVLEISDNGKGFDPSISYSGRIGLQSMQERLMLLQGTLEVTSMPGRGTRVRAVLKQDGMTEENQR